MKRRNIIIIAAFAVVILALILIPSSKKGGAAGGPPGAPGKKGPAAGQAAVFSVRTTQVKRGSLQDYIKTNGDIIVDSEVEVYPDASGKLVSLKVSLGSRVAKGQHIADIDPSTPGSRYELNPVRSTIDGTITSLPLSTGAKVTTSSVIAKVGDIDELQIKAQIPERYVGVLKSGLKGFVTLEAYPQESFTATVIRVSPIVDSTSRTKEIRLAFDRPDPRINAGMFAKVKLNTVNYVNRVLVRESAVLSDSTGSYVFAVNADGTVTRKPVVVGADVDGVMEIESGLAEGDTVVVEGASLLSDGARVKDITKAEAAQ